MKEGIAEIHEINETELTAIAGGGSFTFDWGVGFLYGFGIVTGLIGAEILAPILVGATIWGISAL